jgi:hypothetical protein
LTKNSLNIISIYSIIIMYVNGWFLYDKKRYSRKYVIIQLTLF